MRKGQVVISRCLQCAVKIGCYVENRLPQKITCDKCQHNHCPETWGPDSHGFCSIHFEEAMAKIKARCMGKEVL